MFSLRPTFCHLSALVLALTALPACDNGDPDDSMEGGDANDDQTHDDSDGHDDQEDSTDSGDDDSGGSDGLDADGTDTAGDDDATAATVSGTIEYSGSETGNLIVGLFTSNPPAGPPAVFPPFTSQDPTFPVQYEMSEVPPGEYYVIGLLDMPVEGSDTGNNMPDDGEPYAASEVSIVVEAGGSYEVDLTLMIP